MDGTSQTEQGHEELRRQMSDEARRLRALAASVRAQSVKPELAVYVKSGRGPKYQRDYEAWMGTVHAAMALDEAASRLERVLASSRL